jgi:hypothetical protein
LSKTTGSRDLCHCLMTLLPYAKAEHKNILT